VVKPLTSEQKFESTKALVEDFCRKGGLGEKLQKKLIERHAKKENWVNSLIIIKFYTILLCFFPVDQYFSNIRNISDVTNKLSQQ